ncbi:MAG: patatin-like phospholipase family protein [Solirubrobacterales bacterium]
MEQSNTNGAVPESSRIGLVLSGGGARGAYEAGVMAVLGPALAERGKRPSIYIGTSVGAVNAAYMAASEHLPADEAGEGGLRRWREVSKSTIIRPILLRQAPLTFLRYAGEILSLPGMRLPSLLDPKPFERNLDRWIDWDAVHRNVDNDVVEIVATVATAARSGRTVVFVEGHAERIKHKSHAIDYVTTRLDDQHVRASAAIPILFPSVRVEHPSEARGWYFDGGTRLNTPIKPALDLGAERLIVIATDSVAEPSKRPGRHDSEPPDFGDGALHVLQGMLVDPVVEDMRILGNINMFFAERGNGIQERRDRSGRRATDQPTERYRAARGKPPYRCIPYIFIAPEKRGAIGRLATEVFRDRYGGLKGLRSPDFPLLNRLLGGESPTHGELLSYLFFDREFIEELIRMGQRDARRWLRSDPGPEDPWQIEPLDAFTRRSPARAPAARV